MELHTILRRPGIFHRAIFKFFSIALLCFFIGSTARAALQFDAFVGYDANSAQAGILPSANWFPIACELKNDGQAFNAVIEISPGQLGEGQTRRVNVELPTGTLKRVFIPVFSSAQHSYWSVRLLDERGKVRDEKINLQPRRVIPADIPFVGALSRTVSGLPNFPPVKQHQQEYQPAAARLQPGLFPDNPLALEGLQIIYLNSEKALDLSVAQINALLAWLQRGGHLVVGLEQITDVNANRWLHDLLPCELQSTAILKSHSDLQNWFQNSKRGIEQPELTGSKTRKLTSSENFYDAIASDEQFESAELPVITGTLGDGKIVIGNQGTPLAIEAARGRGKITVLMFSPEREPFISWKNRGWFWAKLAKVPTKIYESTDYIRSGNNLSSDGIFGAMIDTKQVRKLPLGWLLLLLVAYLLVIGPLDQYWLKRLKKQMLTWITFPCYVLFFSGLIYFIGFKLRAGDSEWNELSIVDILPNAQRAVLRGETYFSIYSPANEHYSIVGDQPFATMRGEFMASYGGGHENSRANILQHGNNFDADVFVPVWTSQLYVSDWMQPAPLPLTLSAVARSDKWQITVDNKTDRKLTSAHVLLNGRVYELGDLPAKQPTTFERSLKVGVLLTQFISSNSAQFQNLVYGRQRTFGNSRSSIDNLPLSSMAASFISQVNSRDEYQSFSFPEQLDLSRFAAQGQNILLAWDADHSFTSALNRFTPRRLHRNTLLRLVVPSN